MIDHTGQKIGRWTVLRQGDRKGPRGELHWLCRCECGTEREVQGTSLRNGNSPSCGCQSVDLLGEMTRIHGRSRSPEYAAWCGMKTRCYNPRASRYSDYGGRGIQVCERWLVSFGTFLEDMGPRPTSAHSIDRIDPDGNYEPENCRWATVLQQARNKRTTRVLTHDGMTLTASQWAERSGIPEDTIKARIRLYGWSVGDALTIPVRRGGGSKRAGVHRNSQGETVRG